MADPFLPTSARFSQTGILKEVTRNRWLNSNFTHRCQHKNHCRSNIFRTTCCLSNYLTIWNGFVFLCSSVKLQILSSSDPFELIFRGVICNVNEKHLSQRGYKHRKSRPFPKRLFFFSKRGLVNNLSYTVISSIKRRGRLLKLGLADPSFIRTRGLFGARRLFMKCIFLDWKFIESRRKTSTKTFKNVKQ